MSIRTLTTERTGLIHLWNAKKATIPAPSITAEELNTALSVEWTTISTLRVPVTNCNGGVNNPHTHTYSFEIQARVSHGPSPWTHVRVVVQSSRRHVIKRLAYPSKEGPLTAERLVQDLRGSAGEGVGARAVVTEEERLCCGRQRPCGCDGWVNYVCGGVAGVGNWYAPVLMGVAFGSVYAAIQTFFG